MEATTLVAPRGPVSAALAFGAVALCVVTALFALTLEWAWLAVVVPLAVGFVYALYRLPLRVSVLGAACAVVLVLVGAVQGGSVDESLWQVRHMVLLPVRAVLVIWALDGTDVELRTVGRLLVAAALVKAGLGLWLFYVVAPAAGVVPE